MFKRIFLVTVLISLVAPVIFAGTSIKINQARIDSDAETNMQSLILKGANFDSFNFPSITIGDTILSDCLVQTNEIKCPLTGPPASTGGTWRVTVSAGNSPSTNTEIDVFNSAYLQITQCIPGDVVECYSSDPMTRDVGLCLPGYRTCESGGFWSECQNEIVPQVEDCTSDFDEDCDGLTGLYDPDCAYVCSEQGLGVCGDSCIDVNTDAFNCGVCGNVCTSGYPCIDGACSTVCSAAITGVWSGYYFPNELITPFGDAEETIFIQGAGLLALSEVFIDNYHVEDTDILLRRGNLVQVRLIDTWPNGQHVIKMVDPGDVNGCEAAYSVEFGGL